MQFDPAPPPPAPPSSPGPWTEFRDIRVTEVVKTSRTPSEPKFEVRRPAPGQAIRASCVFQFLTLADLSWKLICFPTSRIESNHAEWLRSESAIIVSEKTENDKYYEAMIHQSFAQKLKFWEKGFYLDYDPTAPTKEKKLTYDSLKATKKGRARFLRKAANTIRTAYSKQYEEYCTVLARSIGLGIALERALLIRNIMVSLSLLDSGDSLTCFKHLSHPFASVLHNTSYSLAWMRCRIMSAAKHLTSLRRTRPRCFDHSRNAVPIHSKTYQMIRPRRRKAQSSKRSSSYVAFLNFPAVWWTIHNMLSIKDMLSATTIAFSWVWSISTAPKRLETLTRTICTVRCCSQNFLTEIKTLTR